MLYGYYYGAIRGVNLKSSFQNMISQKDLRFFNEVVKSSLVFYLATRSLFKEYQIKLLSNAMVKVLPQSSSLTNNLEFLDFEN